MMMTLTKEEKAERVKAKRRARYAADPKRELGQVHAKRLANPDEVRARDRAYYWDHLDKMRDRHRIWQRENKSKVRGYRETYLIRRAGEE
jgi:hypothetical protein